MKLGELLQKGDKLYSTGRVLADTEIKVRTFLGSGGTAEVHLYELVHQRQQIAVHKISGDKPPVRVTVDPGYFTLLQDVEGLVKTNAMSVRRVSSERKPSDCFVQEIFDGKDLVTLSEEKKLPKPVDFLESALAIKGTLTQLASLYLVHNDVTPGNWVILTDGETLLTDIGLLAYPRHSGLLAGTPGFISPEKLRGEDVTPASDIFSLGMIVAKYFGFSIIPPVISGDPSLLLGYIRDNDVRPCTREQFEEVPRILREPLRQVLRRALDPDPSGRDDAEITQRLEDALEVAKQYEAAR